MLMAVPFLGLETAEVCDRSGALRDRISPSNLGLISVDILIEVIYRLGSSRRKSLRKRVGMSLNKNSFILVSDLLLVVDASAVFFTFRLISGLTDYFSYFQVKSYRTQTRSNHTILRRRAS